MTVRIWHSFSCNNSSSARLIARFADAATVEEVAAELEPFFRTHAEELEARAEYSDEPSEASRALGAKYGFEWPDLLYWSTGELVGDEPEIFAEGSVMIVLHTYCGGGFGDGLAMYLEKRGATSVQADDSRQVALSILFRAAAGADPALDAELAAMDDQLDEGETSGYLEPLLAPWPVEHEAYGNFAWFRDAGTVGLHVMSDPRDIHSVHAWLAKRGISNALIRIEDRADFTLFGALAAARCRACEGPVEYLVPGLHDIETPQVVCRPCGGFYEPSAFLPQESR